MKNIRLYILIALSIPFFAARAETDTRTRTMEPRFQTLKVMQEGDLMASPIIELGSDQHISVNFDEIGEDYSDLQYRLIHCNSDWQPSRLMESEYLDGFNEADVEDYAFSSNTYIHYVNYQITIPNERMRPLVSGNYLLQVYERGEPDTVLLQARFQVTVQSAMVAGRASGRTDQGINTEFQQLSLKIMAPREVQNPYQDLIITVIQDNKPETERLLRRPLRVEGNTLTYESMPELIYPAGNEFRRFETVRADYPGMHVDSTRYYGPNYHAFLATDYSRADREYIYDQTQRGRYVIDEYNSSDPNLGADYITTHFTLDFPQLMDGEIFVSGEFTGNLLEDRYRMRYNPERGVYELALPLKQGSYNYEYVARRTDGRGTPSPAPTEGNYAETSNEYNVCVYLRTPTGRADRLIGTAKILSER